MNESKLTVGLSVVAELDKCVSARLARLPVPHDVHVLDVADDPVEGPPERLLARLVVQAPHENCPVRVRPKRILVDVRSPY